MQSLINSLDSWKGEILTSIFTKETDLTKNGFSIPGVDALGKPPLVRPNAPHTNLREINAGGTVSPLQTMNFGA
ncbi:MAG: hypothetical protein Q8O81_06760 [Giesbergeria sp.]|nr:hypothetical protein [Giesbergeria sp.]